jgi:predicted O-methyltransferase YrrM
MRKINMKKCILGIPVLREVIVFVYRIKIVLNAQRQTALEAARWLLHSRETTNFTYDLTPLNKRYLASVIALIVGKPHEDIQAYIDELDADDDLKRHISALTANSGFRFVSDQESKFSRRIGWYAIARAIKPKVIVETGVDKGLGSCILTAALMRNKAEGYAGYYYGTDINPEAGWLLSGRYSEFGRILIGDSIASLKDLDARVDLFINDSAHSADYEEREYQTIVDRLSEDAIILGDNSHCTDKLFKFAQTTGRHFLFFAEKPYQHWYSGGGIGIAFHKSR